MILIIGASGFLGREVTKLLLSKGEQIRLLVRTPAKVEDLKQAGAEIMQGDLIDPSSLARWLGKRLDSSLLKWFASCSPHRFRAESTCWNGSNTGTIQPA